jgi:outer membrane protein assembly factor BamA
MATEKKQWQVNKIKYNIDYKKNQVKQIKIELNRNTENDLIQHLEKQPNKQGYIKKLIIEDMKKEN